MTRDDARERAWKEFQRKRKRGDYPSDEDSFNSGWYLGEREGLERAAQKADTWLGSRIVECYGWGIYISPEVPEDLAKKIRALARSGETKESNDGK